MADCRAFGTLFADKSWHGRMYQCDVQFLSNTDLWGRWRRLCDAHIDAGVFGLGVFLFSGNTLYFLCRGALSFPFHEMKDVLCEI